MEVVEDHDHEYLEKRMEELKEMSEKQEAIANYYDTKLHTVIAAYFIWERIFFFISNYKTNSSTSLSSSCNSNWWVILALSCLCSFVYMLLFVDAALMLYRTEHQLSLILQKHARLYRQIWTIRKEAVDRSNNIIDPSSMMEAGGDHQFINDERLWLEEEFMMPVINSNSTFRRSHWERKFYAYTIFCALLGVAALELYASKSMLCN